MTISGSLSSALSGLTAASRAAEIVSSNIANAMTEGYGRRELQLSARVVGAGGQGVRINGVLRVTNPVAIADRRLAQASNGEKEARAAFLRRLEGVIGSPDLPGSLSGRIAALDQAMISAAARPESEALLSQVANAASNITSHLARASNDIQAARTRADDQIRSQVGLVNTTLARIAELNTEIRSNSGTGRDASSLMDQRQQAIDQIAAIIPLREIPGDGGTVALYSSTGATLLEGRPAVLGFTPVGAISAQMTIGSGALSGLTLNGRAISASGENSLIAGGSLAGNFAVRDELGVQAQGRLDAVARDLVERFQDPAVDPTLAVGDAGLFTDGGLAFDPGNETGLSARLRMNAAADPLQGGQLWRLRDGLGAAAPGAVGDSSLLNAMGAALNAAREPVSGGFMAGGRSLSVLAGDYVSAISSDRLSAESEATFALGKAEALKTIELEEGVDTDAEMQKLLMIEQSYSANAKVIQMVGEMIQTLIGL